MTGVRVFFVGGLLSFRALFSFLRPEIYIPSMLVAPIFQILLFVYIGRSAGLESDEFFVIGNAVQYAAIPCLFAMTSRSAGSGSSTRSVTSSSAPRHDCRCSSAGRFRRSSTGSSWPRSRSSWA